MNQRSKSKVVFAHPQKQFLVDLLPGQYALFPTRVLISLHKLSLGLLNLLLLDLRQVVARNGLELKQKRDVSDFGVLGFCSLVVDRVLLFFLLLPNLAEDVLCFILYNRKRVHILDMFFLHSE